MLRRPGPGNMGSFYDFGGAGHSYEDEGEIKDIM